ncbi:hypothetical protein TNCT_131991 [Trichonephila clavata]|uniref:Uncharacterized protein n=1 Tax=Trichonephila clavata TaxID=2740835 RepID=A0A8X6M5P9_TRICU|nr:hypothetical protein TNCT_131991 [Trichonephila clavata]
MPRKCPVLNRVMIFMRSLSVWISKICKSALMGFPLRRCLAIAFTSCKIVWSRVPSFRSLPFLADLTVLSFPRMPTCVGIHYRVYNMSNFSNAP